MPVEQANSSNLPEPDKNAPMATIPADHQPQTPEFLMKMLTDRDTFQREKDAAWAKHYNMGPRGMTSDTKPRFQEIMEWERLDRELSDKIAGLTNEINELRFLIARKPEADLSTS